MVCLPEDRTIVGIFIWHANCVLLTMTGDKIYGWLSYIEGALRVDDTNKGR